MNKIPLGVSQCLLGEKVRFDGGHKRNAYLTGELAQYVEYRSLCPEVAIGLGIPRKPIRLIVTDGATRVRGVADPSLDVTDQLVEYAEVAAEQLTDICGVFGMKR